MDNIKTRGFRFMLYPDNREHMYTFKRIQRDPDLKKWYCGIWHNKGCGKSHTHILLHFENGRSWYQLLKDTSCDPRWCRPIGYKPDKKCPDKWRRCSDREDSWFKACAYLPHFTDLEKEQYSVNDIFGYPFIVDEAKKNAIAFQSRNLTQAECLLAARTWICSNIGKVITSMMVVKWITGSPYMRIANSVLFRQMIQEHNEQVYYEDSRRSGWDAVEAKMKYEERLEFRKELEHKEFIRALDSGEIDLDDFETVLF